MAKRNKQGVYNFDDGVGYPSVTTIIDDVLSKKGLEYWYGKLGLQEATRMLHATASYGTAAHCVLDASIFGSNTKPIPVGSADAFTERVRRIKDEMSKHGLIPIQGEQQIRCDELGYAGTLDGRFNKNDSVVICDWKTGSEKVFPELLQVSAYAYSVGANEAFIAHVGREDIYDDVTFRWYNHEELLSGLEAFKHVLWLYSYKKIYRKNRRKKTKV